MFYEEDNEEISNWRIQMKSVLLSAVVGGIVMIGASQAFSDEMSSQPPQSKDAMMKDCVAKQHASNTSMSMKDVQNMCAEKVKSAMDPTGTNKVGSGKPDKP
jgi:hypothetical protein